MNQIQTKLLCLVIFGLGFSSRAMTPDTRYNTIVDRNIFRLTTPVPVTNAPPPDPALDKKIELSGISNINGQKKAWFIVTQAKPGTKDTPQYLSLAENERQDSLEVLSISEEKGEVQIKNAGNSMLLSFELNKPKGTPGAFVTPIPPAATAATSVITPQPPAANSYGSYNPPAASTGGHAVTVTGGTPQASAQTADNLRSIPTRNMRLQSTPVIQQPTATAEKVDPLVQRAMMEIQQEASKKTGTPLPPLPPLPQ